MRNIYTQKLYIYIYTYTYILYAAHTYIYNIHTCTYTLHKAHTQTHAHLCSPRRFYAYINIKQPFFEPGIDPTFKYSSSSFAKRIATGNVGKGKSWVVWNGLYRGCAGVRRWPFQIYFTYATVNALTMNISHERNRNWMTTNFVASPFPETLSVAIRTSNTRFMCGHSRSFLVRLYRVCHFKLNMYVYKQIPPQNRYSYLRFVREDQKKKWKKNNTNMCVCVGLDVIYFKFILF